MHLYAPSCSAGRQRSQRGILEILVITVIVETMATFRQVTSKQTEDLRETSNYKKVSVFVCQSSVRIRLCGHHLKRQKRRPGDHHQKFWTAKNNQKSASNLINQKFFLLTRWVIGMWSCEVFSNFARLSNIAGTNNVNRFSATRTAEPTWAARTTCSG